MASWRPESQASARRTGSTPTDAAIRRILVLAQVAAAVVDRVHQLEETALDVGLHDRLGHEDPALARQGPEHDPDPARVAGLEGEQRPVRRARLDRARDVEQLDGDQGVGRAEGGRPAGRVVLDPLDVGWDREGGGGGGGPVAGHRVGEREPGPGQGGEPGPGQGGEADAGQGGEPGETHRLGV